VKRHLSWLAIAAALALGSCTIPIGKVEREPVDDTPGEPKVLRDLGLSCSQCQFSWGSGCSLIEGQGATLVAVVSGAKAGDELRECMQTDGGSQPCVIHRSYRFDDLQFLRRPTSLSATPAFSGSERIDSKNRREGLRLKSDVRYVIVAGRPAGTTMDWSLTAACEVPPTATFPTR
jgi:hypothetical protein